MIGIKINPKGEVRYRLKLAERYLADAESSFRRGDYRATVASSQLSTENSAKAVIALFRVPSWSHDPSHELREVLRQLPEGVRQLARELADYAQALAPEHGRSTYGEPIRGLTPWEIYSKEDAERALEYARKALCCARAIIRKFPTFYS